MTYSSILLQLTGYQFDMLSNNYTIWKYGFVCWYGFVHIFVTDFPSYLLFSGVDSIYLLFVLRGIHSKCLHYTALSFGFLVPIILVLCSFGASVFFEVEIYVRSYTSDGQIVNSNTKLEESLTNTTKICWLRPEFLVELELIPVATILSFNLVVLFYAVFAAFKSASYRFLLSSMLYSNLILNLSFPFPLLVHTTLAGMSHYP